MKQNSAEQPYEAVTRLVDRLKEIEKNIDDLSFGNWNTGFKIVFRNTSSFIPFRKSKIKLNTEIRLELIEVLESKKEDIENELNKLVNGN